MARAPSPAQCSTLEQAKESNRVDKMSEKRILLLAGDYVEVLEGISEGEMIERVAGLCGAGALARGL